MTGQQRLHRIVAVTITVVAVTAIGSTASATPAGPASHTAHTATTGSVFTPLQPTRILDTRNSGRPLGTNGTMALSITSNAGVPANANAVVLTITAVNPSASGFLTVYPDGNARPSTSDVDFTIGQTTANAALVPVGIDGAVDIYNLNGTVDVVADLSGYYSSGSNGTFSATEPTRMLDTRTGLGAHGHVAPLGPGTSLTLQLAGIDGLPTSGLTAVVLNLTATNPTAGGLLTVYPDGTPRPATSNLNFTAQQTIANLVIVPVGSNGQIDIWNLAGATDVVADLFGYYTNGTGKTFTPAGPSRVLDTRDGTGTNGIAPLGADSEISLQVTGTTVGVPTTATAVVLHIAATNPTTSSLLTVYPDGMSRPITSNLDFTTGQIISNLVIVPVGSDGKIDIYNLNGTVDVVAELSGYYD